MHDFSPSELVVLRTPLLPFEEVEAWSADLLAPGCDADDAALAEALTHDRALLRQRLQALLDRPEVHEAVFLASPDLFESLPHWQREPEAKKGRRTEHGLVRYLLRMASRPTPFGLFSGCTAGTLGDRTRLTLTGRRSYRRHSRLDMDYLFALCEHLGRSAEARAGILFRPNSSLYPAAGRLRYAEARLAGRLRTYHLVAVDAFDALTSTLERAASGCRLADLAAALVADDPEQEITLEEAESFLQDLVDNQVLLPELALQVTGAESGPALLDELSGLAAAAEAEQRLGQAQRELEEIDAEGLGAEPERYRRLARQLEPLGVSVEMSRLFQVDLTKPGGEVALGPEVIEEIRRGVELLHRLVPARDEGPLDDFRANFRERYGEGREVPLLLALDEECGIGFERSSQAAADASPLLSGLAFRPRQERRTVTWSEREATLLRVLTEALAQNRPEIELTEELVERLAGSEQLPLPDAFHVMVSLAARSAETLEKGDFRLELAHAGGPSGARLLGRFCHADEAIRVGVAAHLAAEEALAPQALFAEVVHLPAGRIGNILARPVLRGHEIPFLGRSGAPETAQIPAGDLLVTVVGSAVRLRSESLGREVIPRLTTAHNSSRESLGVYRFLAALQGQGRAAGLVWSWGLLEAAPYLPRVTSGRLVLARARWRLAKADLEPLTSSTGAARYGLARQWRQERRMPRFLALVDGDNELLLDFANVLSLDAVIELVKNREELLLAEVFPAPDELCAEGPEGRFVHELVVPFVRRAASLQSQEQRPRLVPRAFPAGKVQRSFPPGSAWLYAKLYTGTSTADQVLREVAAPLAREVMANRAADRWFFLRYADPDWHLRLRFGGQPEALRSVVLPCLHEAFETLLGQGLVHRVQLDTYEREVERYGGPEGIDLAEALFHFDSEAVLEILDSLSGDAGADLRWRVALAGMDALLGDLGYDIEQRLELAERGRNGFASRYHTEGLRQPLANKLRGERAGLNRLLTSPETAPEEIKAPLETLRRRSRRAQDLIRELKARETQGRLTVPIAEIAPSLLHMFVNRLSRSAGPEHELVLYDFLAQLYASQLARGRKSNGQAESPATAPALAR